MSKYTKEDICRMIEEEDVEFIRLQFTDMFGTLKNVAVTTSQLDRVLNNEIMFDGASIAGFAKVEQSDLFLYPDIDTFTIFPWRPQQGKVARFLCDIYYSDGTPFKGDPRYMLKRVLADAKEMGYRFDVGPECEFFLFHTDDEGNPTTITHEKAGYFDVGPLDLGENARRDMILTLEEMGFVVEASHHEDAPAQHEIDFHYDEALNMADAIMTFKMAVKTIAKRHGLYASFMPKPKTGVNGNGMHINMSVTSDDGRDLQDAFMAGILAHIREITLFLNPHTDSYQRLGEMKAPRYISWSKENRSQLIRIPAMKNGRRRIELRSPDPCANPYLCYALLIHAGLDGIRSQMEPPAPLDVNLFQAEASLTRQLDKLPQSHQEAWEMAERSEFVKRLLPGSIIKAYRY